MADVEGIQADTAFVKDLSRWAQRAPSAIAKEAGLTPTTLLRPFNGTATTRLSQPTLDKLRAAFPDYPGWPRSDPGLADIPEANATPIQFEGASQQRMRQNLPIFGTGLGADEVIDGEAVEQTTLNTGEIIGYAKRPVLLDGRTDVYGIYVQGSSMSPKHNDGDTIFVERKRPPGIGDDVVVYLRMPDEIEGERTSSVLVKELHRKTANFIELKQYRPEITFRIDAKRVERMDRVIPWRELVA